MRRLLIALACCLSALAAYAQPRGGDVTGTITVTGPAARPDLANVAVWLTPIGSPVAADAPAAASPRPHLKMVQENKRFTPHMLVVRVGSIVDFPNADPFFHNVFSLYDGKRFDLGLYESGASRGVTFTRQGVCFVFCNIHPEMSAVIVVVETPYFAISTRGGAVTIADVPPGRYTLSAWHERYTVNAAELPREVTITATARALGTIHLVDSGRPIPAHTNKYGHDYTPPPSGPLYK